MYVIDLGFGACARLADALSAQRVWWTSAAMPVAGHDLVSRTVMVPTTEPPQPQLAAIVLVDEARLVTNGVGSVRHQ